VNLVYDPKIKEMLCPKCRGIADWNDNGDLECSEDDCKYIYTMFTENKAVNYFQLELFNE